MIIVIYMDTKTTYSRMYVKRMIDNMPEEYKLRIKGYKVLR